MKAEAIYFFIYNDTICSSEDVTERPHLSNFSIVVKRHHEQGSL